MPQAVKERVPVYVTLLIFIIAKIPSLHTSFYWDESWVYAPGVKLMYAHGASLLPDAIPVDYSRGHPLFFHFIAACWMDIFGASNFSMHCFALFVASLLAIALYEVMRKMFDHRTAFIGLLLLLLDISFFVASSAVLTDVMICLLSFLSFYFYVRARYLVTAVTLACLFLTKECGVVAAAAIGIDIVWGMVGKKDRLRVILMKCATLLFPALILSLFFVVQKQVLGWYLNPSHIGAINLGLVNTMYNVQRALYAMFIEERVYCFFLLFLTLVFIAAWQQNRPRYLLLLPLALLIYLLVQVLYYKDAVFYVCTLLLLAAPVLLFIKYANHLPHLQARFIKMLAGFFVLYIYFLHFL